MAKASIELIEALRKTANTLKQSDKYQWGHMGSCNCGFLAQEISKLNRNEIHARAMQRHGDWNEQLNDYCPTSGLPMDDLISSLLRAGLDVDDLKKLEKLSDQKILASLELPQSYLQHNNKDHVITYLLGWADLLEKELIEKIELPGLVKSRASANTAFGVLSES